MEARQRGSKPSPPPGKQSAPPWSQAIDATGGHTHTCNREQVHNQAHPAPSGLSGDGAHGHGRGAPTDVSMSRLPPGFAAPCH
jgi:hypothetical protein